MIFIIEVYVVSIFDNIPLNEALPVFSIYTATANEIYTMRKVF